MTSIDRPRGLFGQSGAPQIKRFKLTEALTTSSVHVNAKMYGWGYQAVPAGGLESRIATVKIYDPSGKLELPKDAIVWAIRVSDVINVEDEDHERHGRWEVISGMSADGIWRFELQGTLSPGGTVDAKLVLWKGGKYKTVGDNIKLIDFIGSFSGVTGNRGYAKTFARATFSIASVSGLAPDVWLLEDELDLTTGDAVYFTTTGTLPETVNDPPDNIIYPGSTYYIRVDDETHYALYYSSDDAISDTDIIEFTGAGDGVHTMHAVDPPEAQDEIIQLKC